MIEFTDEEATEIEKALITLKQALTEKDRELKDYISAAEADRRIAEQQCDELADELAKKDLFILRLRGALTNLHALVKGECPSLLNEDSGGDANLAMQIEQALKEHQP